ncbi:MAG: SRPBCC family protein [Actinomycetota bacterium]|nr:SRPBCC family protein [Actinomycetota bacterium]
MAAIVNSIDIDRPADEVFAYATDPARFPEWQQVVAEVSVEGREGGSRFTTVRMVGGLREEYDAGDHRQRAPAALGPRTAWTGLSGRTRPSPSSHSMMSDAG